MFVIGYNEIFILHKKEFLAKDKPIDESTL